MRVGRLFFSSKNFAICFIILKLLLTFAAVNNGFMKREIFVYKNYFYDFLHSLSEQVVNKIDYALTLLESQDKISKKFH